MGVVYHVWARFEAIRVWFVASTCELHNKNYVSFCSRIIITICTIEELEISTATMYSRRVQSVLLAAVTLCALCQAQLDVTPDQMQQAVDTLAARFSTIRNEGLGIDSLEVNLNSACMKCLINGHLKVSWDSTS